MASGSKTFYLSDVCAKRQYNVAAVSPSKYSTPDTLILFYDEWLWYDAEI